MKIVLELQYELDESEDAGMASLALAEIMGEMDGVTHVTVKLGSDPRPFVEREYDY